jgi:hypothetical protein
MATTVKVVRAGNLIDIWVYPSSPVTGDVTASNIKFMFVLLMLALVLLLSHLLHAFLPPQVCICVAQ